MTWDSRANQLGASGTLYESALGERYLARISLGRAVLNTNHLGVSGTWYESARGERYSARISSVQAYESPWGE